MTVISPTGSELKRWREERGLTQSAAATLFGRRLRAYQTMEASAWPLGRHVELAMLGYDVEASWQEADRLKAWKDEAERILADAPASLRARMKKK